MQRQLTNIQKRTGKKAEAIYKNMVLYCKLFKEIFGEDVMEDSNESTQQPSRPSLKKKNSARDLLSALITRTSSSKDLRSTSFQTRGRSESFSEKLISAAEKKKKINNIIKLFIILVKIELDASRHLNLNFTLEVRLELNRLYNVLSNPEKFTARDRDTLKSMSAYDDSYFEEYSTEVYKTFHQAIDQLFSSRNLRDSIYDLYINTLPRKEKAAKHHEALRPLVHKLTISKDNQIRKDIRVTLDSTFNELIHLREIVSFPIFNLSSINLSVSKASGYLSIFDNKFSLLNRTLDNILEIYQNFSNYEKIISVSIEILKSSDFRVSGKKKHVDRMENALFSLIHNCTNMIQALIKDLTPTLTKLNKLEKELRNMNSPDEIILEKVKKLQLILEELIYSIQSHKDASKLIQIFTKEVNLSEIITKNLESKEGLAKDLQECIEKLNSDILDNNNNNNNNNNNADNNNNNSAQQQRPRFELRRYKAENRVGNFPLFCLTHGQTSIAIRTCEVPEVSLETTNSAYHHRMLETTLTPKEPSLTRLYDFIPGFTDSDLKLTYNFEISEWVKCEELRDRFNRLFKGFIPVDPADNNNDNVPEFHYENLIYFFEKIVTLILNLEKNGLWLADMKPENILVQMNTGEVCASDLKMLKSIMQLLENEPYYTTAIEYIMFTAGYWTENGYSISGGNQTIHVNHNIIEALIYSFYSLLTLKEYTGKNSFRDSKIKEVRDGLDKNYLIPGNPLADVIRNIFEQLLEAESLEVATKKVPIQIGEKILDVGINQSKNKLDNHRFKACLYQIQSDLRAAIQKFEITPSRIMGFSTPEFMRFKSKAELDSGRTNSPT